MSLMSWIEDKGKVPFQPERPLAKPKDAPTYVDIDDNIVIFNNICFLRYCERCCE